MVIPYELNGTVTLYSGQQLRGVGARRDVSGSKTISAANVRYRVPLIELTRLNQDASFDLAPTYFVAASRTGGDDAAEHVVIRDLDIHRGSNSGDELMSYVPPERTIFDLGAARYCTVSHVTLIGVERAIRVEPSQPRLAYLNWFESCVIDCGKPVTLGEESADCTFWSGRHASTSQREPTHLYGTNNQAWFGVFEPVIDPPFPHVVGSKSYAVPNRPPIEFSQVDIHGTGSGLFAMHIEGNPSEQFLNYVEANPPISLDRYCSVRLREASQFAHVSYSHITQEGRSPRNRSPGDPPPRPSQIAVVVERDAAATMVRFVPSSFASIQPTYDAGLTNILSDATFGADEAPAAPDWTRRDGAEITYELRRDAASTRALDRALRIAVPSGTAQVDARDDALQAPPGWLSGCLLQSVTPGANNTLRSVAGRTFSAGCWIRTAGAQHNVWIRLTELAAPDGRVFIGNSHESNCQRAQDWRFLSTTLHTSANALSIRFEVVAETGADFTVSEPILVEGLHIPPFHPRPMTERGGTLARKAVLPGAGEHLTLGAVGRLRGGLDGAAEPAGHAFTLHGGELVSAWLAFGRVAIDEVVCCWVYAERSGYRELIRPFCPWVVRGDDKAEPSTGRARRIGLAGVRATVPAGARLSLHTVVLRRTADRKLQIAESPSSSDIALTLGIRSPV